MQLWTPVLVILSLIGQAKVGRCGATHSVLHALSRWHDFG
jgi:hypothetical protein